MNYLIPLFVILVVIILFILICKCNQKETFVNKDKQASEIYHNTKNMFESNPSYESFKKSVPYGDSVIYSDLKKLSSQNKFNVENIKKII